MKKRSRYNTVPLLFFLMLSVSCKTQQKLPCDYILNDNGSVEFKHDDSVCIALEKLLNDSLTLFIYLGDSKKDNVRVQAIKRFLSYPHANKHAFLFWEVENKDFIVYYSESLKADSYVKKRHTFGKFIFENINRNDVGETILNFTTTFRKLFSDSLYQGF